MSEKERAIVNINGQKESPTGSYVESVISKNGDSIVEILSQVRELRDYLLGEGNPGGFPGVAGSSHAQPPGFFSRLESECASQRMLLEMISDVILEVRNNF